MASDQCLETRLVTELLYLESKAKRLRESAFDPRELYVTDIRGLLKKPIELGNADKYEKPPEWPLTMAQLEAERPKKWPPSCDILDKSKFKYPHWPTIDLLLSIDMAKALPVFQKLEVDDQEALLRHVALVNSIITQAFYSRHYNETTLTYPNGFQPIGLRKKFSRFVRPVPEQLEYDVFCRTLEPLMRVGLTSEEYVLLKALVYCLGTYRSP
ncbi:Protein NHR-36 [Aphelenchoides avenae]|nr:Protein NHR-36 [Aphelenchus avenae]